VTVEDPEIKLLSPKKIIGMKMQMTLADDKTGELWRTFMPRRKEIQNNLTHEFISMQLYSPTYFKDFDPGNHFEKWAAIEVQDLSLVPEGMNSYTIPYGLYSVFYYKGFSQENSIFKYIFTDWLPRSNYLLENRPHFEILGEKYKNQNPNSEEEIWIPIIRK
jgi:AraC family transcriptional regulator